MSNNKLKTHSIAPNGDVYEVDYHYQSAYKGDDIKVYKNGEPWWSCSSLSNDYAYHAVSERIHHDIQFGGKV